MFQDVDASLAALMTGELGMAGVDVSFAAPDEGFPPSGVTPPVVSFFLYDIRENVRLRGTRWETEEPRDGMATRTRPPVRVDCSYLITAWPSELVTNPAEDEHRILGAVLKVLLRHRRIPETYLRGELVGQQPPVPTRILAENQLHGLGEFWQAMGGRPKTTLHYGITLSVDVFDPVEVGPAVRTTALTLTQTTQLSQPDRR